MLTLMCIICYNIARFFNTKKARTNITLSDILDIQDGPSSNIDAALTSLSAKGAFAQTSKAAKTAVETSLMEEKHKFEGTCFPKEHGAMVKGNRYTFAHRVDKYADFKLYTGTLTDSKTVYDATSFFFNVEQERDKLGNVLDKTEDSVLFFHQNNNPLEIDSLYFLSHQERYTTEKSSPSNMMPQQILTGLQEAYDYRQQQQAQQDLPEQEGITSISDAQLIEQYGESLISGKYHGSIHDSPHVIEAVRRATETLSKKYILGNMAGRTANEHQKELLFSLKENPTSFSAHSDSSPIVVPPSNPPSSSADPSTSLNADETAAAEAEVPEAPGDAAGPSALLAETLSTLAEASTESATAVAPVRPSLNLDQLREKAKRVYKETPLSSIIFGRDKRAEFEASIDRCNTEQELKQFLRARMESGNNHSRTARAFEAVSNADKPDTPSPS